MAAEIEEPVSAGDNSATAEEVKPYKIHVSSRYLNLTKQKLEIARLPKELDDPKSSDWWQPQSQVEPLIDYWLEQYQWREQEEALNGLPQFRTGFTIPQSKSPIRIQFIHALSPHPNVIPLLLIPPFPFSSLSLGHLIKLFTEPEEANHQPFHVVIPSLPGLGFSDALPANAPVISSAAGILDSLMKRLGYARYIASNTGPGVSSPAQIDYKLADWLSTQYPESCLGTHVISPPLTQPRLKETPLAWAKWSIAKFFEASIYGYRSDDFSVLRQRRVGAPKKSKIAVRFRPSKPGLTEPNTLSYALCDSPTGLLVFVMKGLCLLAPQREFTPTEIINFTQLAWLPGPESAMRFWGYCERHPETTGKNSSRKSDVALTVFLGDAKREAPQNGNGVNGNANTDMFDGVKPSYSCPTWAKTRYNVLHTNRVSGNPSLLAWERPEIIAAGVRGLAAALIKLNKWPQLPTIKPETAPPPGGQEVAAGAETTAAAPPPSGEQQQQPSSPVGGSSEVSSFKSGLLAPPNIGERLSPVREISDETKVASHETLPAKTPSPVPTTPSPGPPSPPAVVTTEAG